MLHRQGVLKLWFDYLRLALMNGVPINEDFYASWGTKEQILNTPFNRWWRERGRDLFRSQPEKLESAVKLIASEDGSVTVQIATDMPMATINRQVGRIVTKARSARTTRALSAVAVSGQVNYKNLAAYKRYLEIDLDPRHSGSSIAEKIALFKEVYRKIHERMRKQRDKLRKKGDVRSAARFASHEPDTFDTSDKLSKTVLSGFSPKKAHRWRISGKLVLLNVAEGRFPGDGYYGPKIAATLADRKKKLGINTV